MSDTWPATRTSDWRLKRGGAELAAVHQCSKTRSVARLTVPDVSVYSGMSRPIKTSAYHTWHACVRANVNRLNPRASACMRRGVQAAATLRYPEDPRGLGTIGVSRKVQRSTLCHDLAKAARPPKECPNTCPATAILGHMYECELNSLHAPFPKFAESPDTPTER